MILLKLKTSFYAFSHQKHYSEEFFSSLLKQIHFTNPKSNQWMIYIINHSYTTNQNKLLLLEPLHQ